MSRNGQKSESLIPIYRLYNHQEIALIKMILEGAGICYFIRNEITTIGSIAPTNDAFTELFVENPKSRRALNFWKYI